MAGGFTNDMRFSNARQGPWANGPLDDPNLRPQKAQNWVPPEGDKNKAQNWVPPQQGHDGVLPNGTGSPDNGNNDSAGLWAGAGGNFGAGGDDPDTGGSTFFDEGGTVDPMTGDEGNDPDPMGYVKQALTHGRTKLFQLPPDLWGEGSGDQEGSYEDGGGVVPMQQPQQQPQQQQQTPDPKHALLYMTGEGAIQPELAQALEQRADPQGTMDPGQRMMRVAQMVGKDPNALFSYLQRKRTDFNGHVGAFQAALKRGQLAQAAHHATEAMSNVPGAHNVKFAPAQGGLAMMQQGGGAPQQEAPEQPQPDADGDFDGDEAQGAADGGVIETDETNPTAILNSAGGARGSQPGYEDGGEVEETEEPDEDVTGAVTQEEQPQEDSTTDLMGGNAAAQVLRPDDAQKIVSHEAFDRVADNGFGAWLHKLVGNIHDKGWVSGIGHSVMGEAAEAGPITKAIDRTDPMAMASDALTGGVQAGMRGVNTLSQKLKEGVKSARDALAVTPKQYAAQKAAQAPAAGQYASTQMNQDGSWKVPRATEPLSMEPKDTPSRRERIEAMDAHIAQQKGDGDEEARLQKRDDMIKRIVARRHPWVGGGAAARERDEAEMRKYLYGEDAIRTKANTEGKMGIEKYKADQQMQRLQLQENGRQWRSQNSAAKSISIAKIQAAMRGWNAQQREAAMNLRTIMAQNPGISPEDALEKAKPLARSVGLEPKQMRDMVHAVMYPDHYGSGEYTPDNLRRAGITEGYSENAPSKYPPIIVNKKTGKRLRLVDPKTGDYEEAE